MPVPAAIVVIVNSSAGTAAKRERIEVELADLFRAAGTQAEVIALERGQDPAAVARDASARASIVVAGRRRRHGQQRRGRQSSIRRPRSACFPLGTLNHFAKDLHIPLDLADAIGVVAARSHRPRRCRPGQRSRVREQQLDRPLSVASSKSARRCGGADTASGRRWRSRRFACSGAIAA